MDYLGDPGKFITQSTDNHRETAFLFHQLLVLIQRYIHCNTVVILGTFAHIPKLIYRGPKSKPLANYQQIVLNRGKACQCD